MALDLQQAARSQNAVRLPGGSNTAQDLAADNSFSPHDTILKTIVTAQRMGAAGAALGGTVGAMMGGPIGAGAGTLMGGGAGRLVGGTLETLRQAGITKAEDLITEAMLDPALARILLMKATPVNDQRVAVGVARRFAKLGAYGATGAAQAGSGEAENWDSRPEWSGPPPNALATMPQPAAPSYRQNALAKVGER